MLFVKIKKKYFIIFSILLSVFLSFFLTYFLSFLNEKPIHSETLNNYSTLKSLIFRVLIGPFLETLIFQAAIIEFIMYHLKIKKLAVPVLVSGIIFGIVHYFNNFNVIYMVYAILLGFILSLIYVIAKKRKDTNPFLITFICHFFINLIAFILRIFNT
ncbi:MAG: hypothetical protein CSA39_05150 [Flavobacteriales bacterium]|nr:MAG: hypothetical protein CSA39_05150 [Flavobacteriales bacterium]